MKVYTGVGMIPPRVVGHLLEVEYLNDRGNPVYLSVGMDSADAVLREVARGWRETYKTYRARLQSILWLERSRFIARLRLGLVWYLTTGGNP
jgi:hypothetical protein